MLCHDIDVGGILKARKVFISSSEIKILSALAGLLLKDDRKRSIIMGLENREGGNFITILNGKFCQKVPENTPGAVSRVNKLGKTVFEKFYDSFTAKLINIKTQDGAYGKNWLFVFKDQGAVYNLQLSYSNSFATAFLKMLPNIDLTKEMKLSPSVKEVDGKNKSSLFVNQDGNAIKHAYTKDHPNGMPDMVQVKVKNQLVWDDTARLEFLHAMVESQILPKLPKQEDTTPASTATESAQNLADELNDNKDNDF